MTALFFNGRDEEEPPQIDWGHLSAAEKRFANGQTSLSLSFYHFWERKLVFLGGLFILTLVVRGGPSDGDGGGDDVGTLEIAAGEDEAREREPLLDLFAPRARAPPLTRSHRLHAAMPFSSSRA